jgi:hypothetical protein
MKRTWQKDLHTEERPPLWAGSLNTNQFLGIDDGEIIYSGEFKTKVAVGGVLDELIAATRSETALRRFCKKWGAPSMCKLHGIPTSHSRFGTACVPKTRWIKGANGDRRQEFLLPIAELKRFVDSLECLARIGVDKRDGNRVNPADWQQVVAFFAPWTDDSSKPEDLRSSVLHFELLIDRIVDISGLRPLVSFERTTKRWRLDIGTPRLENNLLALAVHETLLRVTNQGGYSRCDACQQTYFPKRSPNPNKLKFCKSCGRRASWKFSKKRTRAGAANVTRKGNESGK